MRDWRSRFAGRTNDERGFTLIEVMVSMVVFAISISMVYQAVILVQGRTEKVEGSAFAAGQVRQALAQIDRQVRSGNVLYSPENERPDKPDGTVGCEAVDGSNAGTCMRVYTQANGAQRCVQWQVLPDPADDDTSVLRFRAWSADWTTDPTGASVSAWETVARGLVLDPSQAPFTLDADSAYGSRLLNVHFESLDERRSDPTVLRSSLSGRNTNYGYDAGQCTPVPPA